MKKICILILIVFFSLSQIVYGIDKNMKSSNNKLKVKQYKESGILYKNTGLGFSIVLPNYWKNKYYIESKRIDDTYYFINIEDKATMLKLGSSNIFSIAIFKTMNKWNTVGKSLRNAVGVKEIYNNGREVFALVYPSDVEYSLNDKKLHDGYFRMSKDINKIIKTFKRIK